MQSSTSSDQQNITKNPILEKYNYSAAPGSQLVSSNRVSSRSTRLVLPGCGWSLFQSSNFRLFPLVDPCPGSCDITLTSLYLEHLAA